MKNSLVKTIVWIAWVIWAISILKEGLEALTWTFTWVGKKIIETFNKTRR